MIKFDDKTIHELFGADAAEDEDATRFVEYFYENAAYESLNASLPLRILVGHKGVGKSALLKRAYLSDQENKAPCVWLQPEALLNVQLDTTPNDQFVRRIHLWKKGILREILLQLFGAEALNQIGNMENATPDSLAAIIIKWLDQAKQSTSLANAINIYIDDIDRGWKATSEDITNISALLNATRDLGGKYPNIRFRIGLRSDVYFLVRTSDESTDKVDGNIIWLRWANNDILKVIARRVSTFFKLNYSQDQIENLTQGQITTNILKNVIEIRFAGRGRWENKPTHYILLSLTRARPRDLIKLLRLAAKSANKRGAGVISSADLNSIFEEYSQERLQDIINEFKSEMPEIERLVLSMKPNRRERATITNYSFTTDQLTAKIKDIIGQNSFSFTNKKSVTPRSLIQFLYKIDFITARRTLDDGTVDRKYFEQSRFLGHEIIEFGYGWEIHPAYRWALQPSDVGTLLDLIDV
ncbi:P-loop ATPase, Sll1717 family [Brucella pituitosa]|uniref:P-loop ATPase, Sll1717 family n=1 Tax=Brucella pituitosa TaxID=571256 RepID=UPI0009A19FC8|nr:hypothetical protein [Brucella pituitosa]